MGKLIDLTGEKFGKLTVLGRSSEDQDKKKQIYWDCLCECGIQLPVLGTNLRGGKTTSCGCAKIKEKKPVYKKCRYEFCSHPVSEINISEEEHEIVGSRYYHPDCLKKKEAEEQKKARTKADIQLIKNLWIEHISNTVVYQQLYKCLNDLMAQGVDSEYLVFTMEYCIKHHLSLHYPMGFKYFADKQEIKDAYKKKKIEKRKAEIAEFRAKKEDDEFPSFKFQNKTSSISSIFGGDK